MLDPTWAQLPPFFKTPDLKKDSTFWSFFPIIPKYHKSFNFPSCGIGVEISKNRHKSNLLISISLSAQFRDECLTFLSLNSVLRPVTRNFCVMLELISQKHSIMEEQGGWNRQWEGEFSVLFGRTNFVEWHNSRVFYTYLHDFGFGSIHWICIAKKAKQNGCMIPDGKIEVWVFWLLEKVTTSRWPERLSVIIIIENQAHQSRPELK